jgi:hypothetical protein
MTETTTRDTPVDYPVTRIPMLTDLGAAGSLVIGAALMLAFGVAWAYLFYPPIELAAAGFFTCAAFAVAALGAAVRELVLTSRWRRAAR